MDTPGQLFVQLRDVHIQLCQCAKFGVASSKIHTLEGSHVEKVLPLWHVLLLPFITGYPTGFCPPVVAIGPQSLSRIRPLVGLQPGKNEKEVQTPFTCPARAMCAPGQLFMWRLDAPVHLCQCAEFGVACQKIHKLRGSHV